MNMIAIMNNAHAADEKNNKKRLSSQTGVQKITESNLKIPKLIMAFTCSNAQVVNIADNWMIIYILR